MIVFGVVALRSPPVCVCISSAAWILFLSYYLFLPFLLVFFFFVYLFCFVLRLSLLCRYPRFSGMYIFYLFFYPRSEFFFSVSFECVRLSCDYGWIPGGSVKVRQSINQSINQSTCKKTRTELSAEWDSDITTTDGTNISSETIPLLIYRLAKKRPCLDQKPT